MKKLKMFMTTIIATIMGTVAICGIAMASGSNVPVVILVN